jgi:hypothetical protein
MLTSAAKERGPWQLIPVQKISPPQTNLVKPGVGKRPMTWAAPHHFGQHGLDMLRQPLEDKVVTISRAQGSVTYPANLVLVYTHTPWLLWLASWCLRALTTPFSFEPSLQALPLRAGMCAFCLTGSAEAALWSTVMQRFSTLLADAIRSFASIMAPRNT